MNTDSETITDKLIAFQTVSVPKDASNMMRLSLFDWAACGISGAQETEFTAFKTSSIALHPGQHRVFGGGNASIPTAALINGTLSHALDYDDTHFAHIGHPSVTVVPAVLALAQHVRSDLATLLEASVIGVEASILVGLWLGRDHYQVGYHQTATAGAFGATLGACRLLELSSTQTRHALGLCASMASGIKGQFGTMAKPLNAGIAARTGVEAALWAHTTMTAAHDGLAGPLGFGLTHHGVNAEIAFPTAAWHILSISHKFHACCHGLHAMLEALSEAKLSDTNVNHVHIFTNPRWMSVCNIPTPQTGLAAKFSYAQTAAMTLLGYDTGSIATYTDQLTQIERVKNLRARVSVSENADLTETQSEIVVTLHDGTTRRLFHDLMAPMTIETRTAKLRTKVESLLGIAHAQTLWNATQGTSLDSFTDQLG